MRLLEHGEEALRVDGGVDLGRRQAGVAQQFLDGAEVAAIGEQMRREGVPQRMRRGALGEAERAT
jgi:hypothetical protein